MLRPIAVRLVLVTVALAATLPGAAKTTYLHGTVGNIEVLSSESSADTQKFLYEFVEIRAELAAITGATLVPDPTTHIVIFARTSDLADLVPNGMRNSTPNWRTTSFSVFQEWGGMVGLVKDDNYEFSRGIALIGYARHLLAQLVPREPLWVVEGLPDFLSTTEYRDGRILLGRAARDYADSLQPRKLLPLAVLTDDAANKVYLDGFKRQTPLYREAWSLWHMLLTDPGRQYDAGVRRLFDALRDGKPGNMATLEETLGLSAEVLQARRKEHAGRRAGTCAREPGGTELMRQLVLAPADDTDRLVGMAIVGCGATSAQDAFKASLFTAASQQPDSARLFEAMAILARASGQSGDDEYYWRRARESGTRNPFPYLQAARDTGLLNMSNITLSAEISNTEAARLRRLLDQCLVVDPGSVAANLDLAWTEAIAPQPRPDPVARIIGSQLPRTFPQFYLPLAIAQWRLGAHDDALQLLEKLRQSATVPPAMQTAAGRLAAGMQKLMAGEAAPGK